MLENKVVLITGATQGIGKEIAVKFAQHKATVIMIYHKNEEKAKEALCQVQAFTNHVELCKVDVSDLNAVSQMIEQIIERHHRIDFLVNNAGVELDKLFMLSNPDEWTKVMNTNFYGAVNCSYGVLKNMVKQRSGRIINIASLSALNPRKGQCIYAASKSALVTFSKTLAKEVGRWNICVNVVMPGMVETDMTRSILKEHLKEELSRIPLGRLGKTEDVANMVYYLCQEESSYLTGSVFKVDGGSAV